ncbi:luciferase domain-containing protein [Solicola gregarius]|uniref:DUF5519 family protein n=1 Tax=Solicola gregarius TaxID=2908642 RepID=A0AA46TMK2_9ACTN|nr:luciferase family protein [Solicola gregarius]UYM07163.1 DUF5519 family protein [Solicola gregarius]
MLSSPRSGARPRTSDEGPHRQLNQRATPGLWGTLVARVFDLDGVEEGVSQVSPPSSRAVFFVDLTDEHAPETSLAPGQRLEPAHLHGVQDTSVHLVLPRERGQDLVGLRWAEPHQHADFGTEFMIYGPRDAGELKVVISVIEESLAFAREGAP